MRSRLPFVQHSQTPFLPFQNRKSSSPPTILPPPLPSLQAPSGDAPTQGDRYFCPFPGCQRSFAELWRLKVHFRASPDVRGSGKERGHGLELDRCPRCAQELKPGKHHVGCVGSAATKAKAAAAASTPAAAAPAPKKGRVEAPAGAGPAPAPAYYPPVNPAALFTPPESVTYPKPIFTHDEIKLHPQGLRSFHAPADRHGAAALPAAHGRPAPGAAAVPLARGGAGAALREPRSAPGAADALKFNGAVTAPQQRVTGPAPAPAAGRMPRVPSGASLPDFTDSEIADDMLLPTLPELLLQEERFQLEFAARPAPFGVASAGSRASPVPRVPEEGDHAAAAASVNASAAPSDAGLARSPALHHFADTRLGAMPFEGLDLLQMLDPMFAEDPTGIYERYAEPIGGGVGSKKPQVQELGWEDLLMLMPCE